MNHKHKDRGYIMEDQKKTVDKETESKNMLYADIDKMMDAMNKKVADIEEGVQEDVVKRLIFNGVISKGLSLELFNKMMEDKEKLKSLGYEINIEEDIECKNLSKGSKYKIIISDDYECYVEIGYEDYVAIMQDYDSSESAFIEKQLQKLSSAGFESLKEASELICDILSVLIYNRGLFIKTYEEIGWDIYNGKDIFKYDTIYWHTNNKIKELAESFKNSDFTEWIKISLQETVYGRCINDDVDKLFSDIEAKNKQEEDRIFAKWIVDITNAMCDKPKVGIILGAACTGMIRPLVNKTKETNINMNICGDRASGKSTVCHLALSLFGDPDRLEGSFSDSDNANEIERVKRPVIPYIIDDRMLKYLENSEQSQVKSLFTSIFKEYEGKVSMRMTGVGKKYNGQRTMAPVISSSVKPLMDIFERSNLGDLGQYRRFIELNVSGQDLFDKDVDADEIDRLAYKQYGFGVKFLAEYLLKDDAGTDFIKKYVNKNSDETGISGIDLTNMLFKEYANHIGDELNQKDKSRLHLSASAQRFALIITSLQIFRLALANKLEEIKANSEYSSKLDEVINILTDNKYIAEASKILVDNLIDTMERINYKADALKNYKLFIEDIKNGKINWVAKTGTEYNNNKSKYIGYFIKKGKDLLNAKLFIMPDKGYEWLILNYDKVTSDFDIQAYINEMNKPFKSDTERNNKIKELTGFNIRSNVADIITAEDKKRLGYVYAPVSSRGGTKTSVFWYNEDGIEPDEINEVINTLKKSNSSKKKDKKEVVKTLEKDVDSKKEGTEA